jgi:hypothetical protein
LENSRREVMAEVCQNKEGQQPREKSEKSRFLDVSFFLVYSACQP